MLVAEHMQETFKRVVSDDIAASARSLTLPSLLIYGRNDEATPFRYGQILQESIVNSKLDVLQHAGHFVHLDEPSLVATKIKTFLQS